MSRTDDVDGVSGNVVPFPGNRAAPPDAKMPAKSIIASAGLTETTRRKEIARIIGPRLSTNKPMAHADRFALARNARNYIYGLEEAGRLTVRKLAEAHFNRDEVRAIQRYVVPQGVETQENFDERHPTRPLVGKPNKYRELVLAAAKLAHDAPENALTALARGTRFWPGAEDVADDERRAANELVELLARIPRYLDEIYPLGRYFDLIEDQQILPLEREGGTVFDLVEEFGWWEQEAIPSVRIAIRWLPPVSIRVVVAVSEVPATEEVRSVDFDALHEDGRSFEAWVSRRQIFSLGIGRIAGIVGPVAIFSHEVVLPDGTDYRVTQQDPVHRLGPGWNRCIIDLGAGPLMAAWQLEEALLHPPDEEDQNYEMPPDVSVQRITADWLLERAGKGWLIPKTTGFAGGMWQVVAQIGRGRIGAADDLPSIIERCLLVQSTKAGPVTDITARYARFAGALKEWRALLDAKAQKRLGQVAAFLAGQPDPDEDRLSHLD